MNDHSPVETPSNGPVPCTAKAQHLAVLTRKTDREESQKKRKKGAPVTGLLRLLTLFFRFFFVSLGNAILVAAEGIAGVAAPKPPAFSRVSPVA